MKSRAVQNSPRRRLLALHGFTGEPYDFAPLYESGNLPLDWRFVTLPGHIREWRPAGRPDDVTGWRHFCEQVSQVVEEASEEGAVLSVLAYSMGARLLLRSQFEQQWPFASLFLVGVSAGLEDAEQRKLRWQSDQQWAALLREQGLDAFLKAWLDQPLLRSQLSQSSVWGQQRLHRKHLLDPEALAQSLLDFSNGSLEPVWDRLHQVRLPVHLIAGEHDLKFRALHERMQSLLSDASCHVLPGVGHAPHLEEPGAFVSLLQKLL